MTSTTEHGHAKNVTNFNRLISLAEAIGPKYSPPVPTISVEQLTALQTQANTVLQTVKDTESALGIKIDDRLKLFTGLPKLSTKILNSLKTSSNKETVIGEAVTINRRIQGKRAKAIIQPTTPEQTIPETISVSRRSYSIMADNLAKLISILKTEPLYAPNETELKIETLQALLESMINTNHAVDVATIANTNAKQTRDTALYAPSTGLYDISMKVKTYLKSLYGPSSTEYKQVSDITFTNEIR